MRSCERARESRSAMSYGRQKTEHAGAKNGGSGFYGPRALAKQYSKVKRRAAGMEITAKEFDARFDAGEDISPWLDLDSAIVCKPGKPPVWAKTGKPVEWGEVPPGRAESLGLKPPAAKR